MQNGPFIDDFPIETSIYSGFPIDMVDYQRDPEGNYIVCSIPKLNRVGGFNPHSSRIGIFLSRLLAPKSIFSLFPTVTGRKRSKLSSWRCGRVAGTRMEQVLNPRLVRETGTVCWKGRAHDDPDAILLCSTAAKNWPSFFILFHPFSKVSKLSHEMEYQLEALITCRELLPWIPFAQDSFPLQKQINWLEFWVQSLYPYPSCRLHAVISNGTCRNKISR